MLLGEHAVLKGHLALVCAVDRHMSVSLTSRNDEIIEIHSPRLGELKSSIHDFKIDSNFKFVTTAIQKIKTQINTGFNLEINANFSHQAGLGSSAAVTAGTVTALDRWLNAGKPFDLETVFLQARDVVQTVQGLGSGADVAASVFGGTLIYRTNPLLIEKLPHDPPLTAVYSGHKKPTVEVVRWLENHAQENPELVNALFEKINQSCMKAKDSIEQADWLELGKILSQNQLYMQELGLSTPLLNKLNLELCRYPEISGSKISGSGMGDCIIGIGELRTHHFPENEQQINLGVQQFNLKIVKEGVSYATN